MRVPSLLTRQMAAMDARMICAVVDQHGGVVIYKGSDPVYYLLAGECYAAISDGQEARISAMRDEDPAPGAPGAPGSGRVGAEPEPGAPGRIGLPQSTAGKFSSTL